MNPLIYTMAYGDEFWECAKLMVRSLRQYGTYGGDIIVFSDRDGVIDGAQVQRDTTPLGLKHLFMAKAMFGKSLPGGYDQVLFLDADLVITNSIYPLLEYPHPFSLPPECVQTAGIYEEWFFLPNEKPYEPGDVGYNAGTIGCETKLYEHLCHTWWDLMLEQRTWELPGGVDQQPLNYLARSGQFPFKAFPREWFHFLSDTADYRPLHRDTIIVHPKHDKQPTMKMVLEMRSLWMD